MNNGSNLFSSYLPVLSFFFFNLIYHILLLLTQHSSVTFCYIRPHELQACGMKTFVFPVLINLIHITYKYTSFTGQAVKST